MGHSNVWPPYTDAIGTVAGGCCGGDGDTVVGRMLRLTPPMEVISINCSSGFELFLDPFRTGYAYDGKVARMTILVDKAAWMTNLDYFGSPAEGHIMVPGMLYPGYTTNNIEVKLWIKQSLFINWN